MDETDYQYQNGKIFYLCLDLKTGEIKMELPIPEEEDSVYCETVCKNILRNEGLKYRFCAKIYHKDDQLTFTRLCQDET